MPVGDLGGSQGGSGRSSTDDAFVDRQGGRKSSTRRNTEFVQSSGLHGGGDGGGDPDGAGGFLPFATTPLSSTSALLLSSSLPSPLRKQQPLNLGLEKSLRTASGDCGVDGFVGEGGRCGGRKLVTTSPYGIRHRWVLFCRFYSLGQSRRRIVTPCSIMCCLFVFVGMMAACTCMTVLQVTYLEVYPPCLVLLGNTEIS